MSALLQLKRAEKLFFDGLTDKIMFTKSQNTFWVNPKLLLNSLPCR